MKWRVVLEFDSESEAWAIWCPELPGCTSVGDSREDALVNIQAAIALYLEPSSVKIPN